MQSACPHETRALSAVLDGGLTYNRGHASVESLIETNGHIKFLLTLGCWYLPVKLDPSAGYFRAPNAHHGGKGENPHGSPKQQTSDEIYEPSVFFGSGNTGTCEPVGHSPTSAAITLSSW